MLPGAGRLDIRAAAKPVRGDPADSCSSTQFTRPQLERLRRTPFSPSDPALSRIGLVGNGHRRSDVVRASLLDGVLNHDYITMARAKGASRLRVRSSYHALANALIPALTILGFTFAYLITGSVLVETIFSWPGVLDPMPSRPPAVWIIPAIAGVTILGGLGFLLANLLADGSGLCCSRTQECERLVDIVSAGQPRARSAAFSSFR